MTAVGRNVRRKDGTPKVTGAAKYIDDISFPGMLHGRTIRAPMARGRILAVRPGFGADDGFTVVDHTDIPGENLVAMIVDDQPCLAAGEIRHFAEPILLLAHEDREALWAARVDVDIEPLRPILDPAESTHSFKTLRIRKGDAAAAMAGADIVVEGEYRTGYQEHAYIETNGMIAVPEDGGVTIYGSLQCPFYVHKAIKRLLGWPAERVRIVQVETGGGFGGKEDYPSMIAGHAALLAIKSGRPVKIVYDRAEDMAATTKRHPSTVRHRTGVTRDGRLVAMEVDVVFDAGAYCTLSPVVLSRGSIHACGPYRCDHVHVSGRAMMTHTPPNGAFRGFGAPQTLFAVEAHMDRVAEAVGLDPVAFRELNALRPGDATATGQVLGDDCAALQVLQEAVARSDYHRKRAEYAGTGKGIGLSLFYHGSGFTGAGEVMLASRASMELTDGGARVLVGSTEIGQGTRTMLAQIAADALRIPFDAVEIAQPDTARVVDSGPTVASRTCMVVGRLLQQCADQILARIGDVAPGDWVREHGPLVVTQQYEKPTDVEWDDVEYSGDAYATYGWGCNVAEVELDPVTYEARPLRMTAALDVGKAIHPDLVAGQIEGGTAQGVGWALNEAVVMKDGVMRNASFTNYIIPTTMDAPRIDAVVMEIPSRHGPHGAKGVGEMPLDGPAPAVVNALRHLGLDVRAIPALPEALMAATAEAAARRTVPIHTNPVVEAACASS